MALANRRRLLDGQIGFLALLRALGAERVIVFTSSVESTQRCRPWRSSIRTVIVGQNHFRHCWMRWAPKASSSSSCPPPWSPRSGAAHGDQKWAASGNSAPSASRRRSACAAVLRMATVIVEGCLHDKFPLFLSGSVHTVRKASLLPCSAMRLTPASALRGSKASASSSAAVAPHAGSSGCWRRCQGLRHRRQRSPPPRALRRAPRRCPHSRYAALHATHVGCTVCAPGATGC